jgi:hypothetical protein
MKNIHIENGSYNFNGEKITFPFKPTYAVLTEDKIIVAFDSNEIRKISPDSEFWRAIWCYDRFGNLIWKVEPPYYMDPYTNKKACPEFVDKDGRSLEVMYKVFYKEKEDMLVAYGTMGYRLDPETGKLGEIVYRER